MRTYSRVFLSLLAVCLVAALAVPSSAQAAKAKVDINTASQQDLEALPGVGEATAKKIIAGRPYSSVNDLSRAGVSASSIEKISGLVKAGRGSASAAPAGKAPASAGSSSPVPAAGSSAASSKGSSSAASGTSAAGGRVDLNGATQKELEDLPGVGAATAKKIIAGRPYSSVADLSKAGVSASTIQKISPLVTVSGARSSSPSSSSAPAASASGSSASKSTASSGGAVDLNTASQKDLEALPGVGAATAKKIIAGRPYSSVNDLSKAGVSASTISKIGSMVTVSGASAGRSASGSSATGSSAAPAAAGAPSGSASRSTSGASTSGTAEYQPPPSPGMVWVNLETKVFHRSGDRWYGKTKHGKYMNEADAVKAGYRLSKEKDEPK